MKKLRFLCPWLYMSKYYLISFFNKMIYIRFLFHSEDFDVNEEQTSYLIGVWCFGIWHLSIIAMYWAYGTDCRTVRQVCKSKSANFDIQYLLNIQSYRMWLSICLCIGVLSIVATPFNLELWNFGVTFRMCFFSLRFLCKFEEQ